MLKLLPTALLTWLLFIPIAILNGVVRESVYKAYVGDLLAHQISTLLAIAAFFTLAYIMLRKVVFNAQTRSLILLGLLWVIMTIAFELGFGHYIDGASWEALLADYNLFNGHVWGLFLVAIFFTPLLVKRLANKIPA